MTDIRMEDMGRRPWRADAVCLDSKPDPPDRSWWVNLTRDAFATAVRDQTPRMSGAKQARWIDGNVR
jgi:hypothetical protein